MSIDNNNDKSPVRDSIRRAMAERGLTSSEVASRMGVTVTAYNLQVCSNPTYKWLRKASQAIGCSVADLLPGDDRSKDVFAVVVIDGETYTAVTSDRLRELADMVDGINK